jgi:hypothetical protein
MLKKILCGCHRCIRYYILFDKNPIEFINSVTQPFPGIDFEKSRKRDEEDFDVEEMKENISNQKNIVYG